ncbi:hypothetical protein IC235_11440 [Hymenobacter sp. BT664]|uniref:Uncharacterized protein n=1 Tax=Hymenobacter montanus TaxID=2771359 RepID=A0A927BCY1_9BACT|nr:hypothetical protein [Hymenobacter montanus]MBD2768501.1 hypothetical protein [Hymenobacter montanus]
MEQMILKQLKWLKIYAITSTIVFVSFLSLAFNRSAKPQRFEEIDVERINIVEKNGALRMVISNEQRQHPGTVDGGKMGPARQRPAGLLFFNNEGEECGGLTFGGRKQASSMGFSFDQYQNDQVIAFQYQEGLEGQQRSRSYGLRLWDRPENFTTGQLLQHVDSLEKLHDKKAYQKGVAELQAKRLIG